jgi:hypothetical protein
MNASRPRDAVSDDVAKVTPRRHYDAGAAVNPSEGDDFVGVRAGY